MGGKRLRQQRRGFGVLEAVDKDRQRAQPARPQRLDQRIDRRRVAGLHQRPIEDDRYNAATAAPFGGDVVEARHDAPWPIEPGAQQRRRLRPLGGHADEARRVAQEIIRVAGAAFGEIAPEPPAGGLRYGRCPRQFGVGLVVARQQRQWDAVLAAGLHEALDPVRPIGAAAEEPRDDQPGLGHQLHIEVDREIVAEPHDRREPQAGRGGVGRPPARLRRRNERDLGVGARQDDDVARCLGEIDCGRSVGDDPGLGSQEVHVTPPPATWPAPRGSPRGQSPCARSRRAGSPASRPAARRGRNAARCGRRPPARPASGRAPAHRGSP